MKAGFDADKLNTENAECHSCGAGRQQFHFESIADVGRTNLSMFLPGRRIVEPEIMDQPGLAPERHHQALRGLERVNRLSRTAGVLWNHIASLARRAPSHQIRVLDLACGGGDVAITIAERARRDGLNLVVHGRDRSPTAIEHARQRAAGIGNLPVEFFVGDALSDAVGESYEVVMCTLFLHHLSDDDGLRLMQKMAEAARCMVLIDDLCRTRWGYVLAWVGCRVLSRSNVVHTDGPMSVQAAYRVEEIRRLATRAGMEDAVITRHWPQRFLLAWTKP